MRGTDTNDVSSGDDCGESNLAGMSFIMHCSLDMFLHCAIWDRLE